LVKVNKNSPFSISKKLYCQEQGGKPKNQETANPYGIFAIRVFSADVQRKILGWMSGILWGKLL